MLVPFRLTEGVLADAVTAPALLSTIRHLGVLFSPSSDLRQTDLPNLVREIRNPGHRKAWENALLQGTIRILTCPEAPLCISNPPSLTELLGCELLILGNETDGASFFDLDHEDPRRDRGNLEVILGPHIGESIKLENAKAVATVIFKKGTPWKEVWDKHFAPILACARNIQVFDRMSGKGMYQNSSGLLRLINCALKICEPGCHVNIEIYTSFGMARDDISEVISGVGSQLSKLEEEMRNSRGTAAVEFYVIPQEEAYHDRGVIIDRHWHCSLGIGVEALSGKTVPKPYKYSYEFMAPPESQDLRRILKKWKSDAEGGETEAKKGCWTKSLWLGGE